MRWRSTSNTKSSIRTTLISVLGCAAAGLSSLRRTSSTSKWMETRNWSPRRWPTPSLLRSSCVPSGSLPSDLDLAVVVGGSCTPRSGDLRFWQMVTQLGNNLPRNESGEHLVGGQRGDLLDERAADMGEFFVRHQEDRLNAGVEVAVGHHHGELGSQVGQRANAADHDASSAVPHKLNCQAREGPHFNVLELGGRL